MASNLVSTAIIASLAIAVFSTTLQAQGAGGGGGDGGDAAEYVRLEPRPEQLVTTVGGGAAAAATNASAPTTCGNCKCCLKSNPLQCLTTCCFAKACNGATCTRQMVSCGCNKCVW